MAEATEHKADTYAYDAAVGVAITLPDATGTVIADQGLRERPTPATPTRGGRTVRMTSNGC